MTLRFEFGAGISHTTFKYSNAGMRSAAPACVCPGLHQDLPLRPASTALSHGCALARATLNHVKDMDPSSSAGTLALRDDATPVLGSLMRPLITLGLTLAPPPVRASVKTGRPTDSVSACSCPPSARITPPAHICPRPRQGLPSQPPRLRSTAPPPPPAVRARARVHCVVHQPLQGGRRDRNRSRRADACPKHARRPSAPARRAAELQSTEANNEAKTPSALHRRRARPARLTRARRPPPAPRSRTPPRRRDLRTRSAMPRSTFRHCSRRTRRHTCVSCLARADQARADIAAADGMCVIVTTNAPTTTWRTRCRTRPEVLGVGPGETLGGVGALPGVVFETGAAQPEAVLDRPTGCDPRRARGRVRPSRRTCRRSSPRPCSARVSSRRCTIASTPCRCRPPSSAARARVSVGGVGAPRRGE
jgi:hypothetical protein